METQADYLQPFTKRMSLNLQAEEAALTIISIYFLTQHTLGLSIWIWVLLFFSPDAAMLGYLAGNRMGAFTYNLAHHRGLALALAGVGFLMHTEVLMAVGILLFAHSSFDRMLGFGLKYSDSFNHTHLGLGGKTNRATRKAG